MTPAVLVTCPVCHATVSRWLEQDVDGELELSAECECGASLTITVEARAVEASEG